MKQFTRAADIPAPTLNNCLTAIQRKMDVCVFDIETTGLSPKVSSVYLIGVLCMENETPVIHQWFADDYTSEKELLIAFAGFLAPFSACVHYNGTTFDIPYLESKYEEHGLPSPFQGKESLDLFKYAKMPKKALSLANKKLATVERALGFHRNDTFSGKDCIDLYTDYMQQKFFRDSRSGECLEKLLLHNHDDLVGTLYCAPLIFYSEYRPENPTLSYEEDAAVLSDSIDGYFPVPLRLTQAIFEGSRVTWRIPFHRGVLYHYYPNYRDYFYLPEEDTAIHKSVGSYVDPAHRKPATASTCYTKKEGVFVPLPPRFTWENTALFQPKRNSPLHYFLRDDKQLPDSLALTQWLRALFATL